MFKKGDFHLHTTASDGEHSVLEVVKLAKEKNLDIISITDHNTVKSLEEAERLCKEYNIFMVPGVEISTRYKGEKIHVLGYFKNENYKLEEFQEVLKCIKKHKVNDLKELLRGKVRVEKDSVLERISTKTGIEILNYFGAKAVLAHPIKVKKDILIEVLNFDFHGIEARYFKNTLRETENFIKLSKEKGWFYTAGSDFHTNISVDKRHGDIGQVFLNNVEIDEFLKALYRNEKFN